MARLSKELSGDDDMSVEYKSKSLAPARASAGTSVLRTGGFLGSRQRVSGAVGNDIQTVLTFVYLPPFEGPQTSQGPWRARQGLQI